ncbi:hypothetical protein ACFQ2K_05675 [Streptomyces sanglieri]|uniref:Transposase n=1 Tax=Streptomyces sanglieri TaxID=193460 RepID=A0ABW2WQ64_9ACTN
MGRQSRPAGASHPGEVQRDETIADLRKQLREAKAQVTEAQGKLDALAAVTANLYHENIALKKKLGSSRRLASIPAPATEHGPVRTDG